MSSTPTGIVALDTFLGGGLPRGFTTLMLAPSGSGGEIFAKQFACGGQGEVVYVSTDETKNEVKEAMTASEWQHDHVHVLDLQSDFAKAMIAAQKAAVKLVDDPGTAPVKKRFDPRELVAAGESHDSLRKQIGKGLNIDSNAGDTDYLGRLINPYTGSTVPSRMVVHSLDFFLNVYPMEQVVASLTALKAANASHGGQVLLVMTKDAHGVATERRMEILADCLIELEVERKGTKFDRFFSVKKIKNRTHGIGVSTYEVGRRGFAMETLERIV